MKARSFLGGGELFPNRALTWVLVFEGLQKSEEIVA